MKTIQTKYHGPGNVRGARISATDCGDHTIYMSYDYSVSGEDVHWQAANALAVKLGWSGRMQGGTTKDGYVFVFVDADWQREVGNVGWVKRESVQAEEVAP